MKYLRSVLLALFMTTCAMKLQASANPTKLSSDKETKEKLLARCRQERNERIAKREAEEKARQEAATKNQSDDASSTLATEAIDTHANPTTTSSNKVKQEKHEHKVSSKRKFSEVLKNVPVETGNSSDDSPTKYGSVTSLSSDDATTPTSKLAPTNDEQKKRVHFDDSNINQDKKDETDIDSSQTLSSEEKTIQATSPLHPWKATNQKRCLTIKSKPFDSSQVLSTEEYEKKQAELAMQNSYDTPFYGHNEEDATAPKLHDPIDDMTALARLLITIKTMHHDFIAPVINFFTNDQPEQTKGFREASAGMTARQRYYFTLRTISNHTNAFRNDCGAVVAAVVKRVWPRS